VLYSTTLFQMLIQVAVPAVGHRVLYLVLDGPGRGVSPSGVTRSGPPTVDLGRGLFEAERANGITGEHLSNETMGGKRLDYETNHDFSKR
jgi:hypothetical protein